MLIGRELCSTDSFRYHGEWAFCHLAMLPLHDGPSQEKKKHGQLLTASHPFTKISHIPTTQLQREVGKGGEAHVTYDKHYYLYSIIIFPIISKISCFPWVSVLIFPFIKWIYLFPHAFTNNNQEMLIYSQPQPWQRALLSQSSWTIEI